MKTLPVSVSDYEISEVGMSLGGGTNPPQDVQAGRPGSGRQTLLQRVPADGQPSTPGSKETPDSKHVYYPDSVINLEETPRVRTRQQFYHSEE